MRVPALALILLSAVSSVSCRRQGSPNVFVDPALAALVPADTVMLGGVRMEQLAKTKFWTDYVQKGRVPMVENFRTRTGIDLGKDLWELLVAASVKDSLVLIRGKFSDMGLEPKLQREGADRFTYKGMTLIGDQRNAVLFLNPSTAAAGSTESLRRVVDNRNNITGLPADLDQRIKKISSTNQAWFVSQLGTGVIPELGGVNAGAFTGILQLARSVKFATGAVDLRTEFDGHVDFETTDPQSADRLGGAIRALLGIGRLRTTDQQREVLSVYDGMHVTKENTSVHLTAEIPYSVLEKAAAELPMLGAK